jgi:hypothetical protein
VLLGNFANDSKDCRFAGTGTALNAYDTVSCTEKTLDNCLPALIIPQDFKSTYVSVLDNGRDLALP